jgi:hypothetical protein
MHYTGQRIPDARLMVGNIVAALLVAACGVTHGQIDRGTDTALYAPRPLQRIADPRDFYPDASKRAHETGEVVLRFRIGNDGIAGGPFVVDEAHSTAPRLVRAAEQLFKLQQTSGLDYYCRLCNPPPVPNTTPIFY